VSTVRALALAITALACGACDAPPSTTTDAAIGRDAATRGIVAQTAPSMPALLPCPRGWVDIAAHGTVACGPPDRACPDAMFRLLGDDRCAPIGDPCPSGEFPDPSSASELYVRAGATGGDGTRERPFGTVAAAMARALPGSRIVLARGTYDERLDVHAGVTVVGACASETSISPPAGDAPAVTLAERDGAIRDLTIAPVGGPGMVVRSGGARATGVIVRGAERYGVGVASGSLIAARIVIASTRGTTGESDGHAVAVGTGATLELTGAHIEDSFGDALLATGVGTIVQVTELSARRNGLGEDGARTVAAQDGPRLELRRSVLEEGHGTALIALGADTFVLLDQVVIRELVPAAADTAIAVVLRDGARLEASRTSILGAEGIGLALHDRSSASIDDTIVAGASTGRADTGFGIAVAGESRIEARRVVLADHERGGILGTGAGSSIDAEDLSITGTGAGPSGFGIGLGAGIVGELRRVRLEHCSGAGVLVTGAGASITFADLAVRSTDARADGSFGRALEAQDAALVRVERAIFESNREVSVLAVTGGVVELSDVRVIDTLERACSDTTCSDAPGGSGLGAYGGTLRASRFEVRRASLCGAQIALGGDMDLTDGEIAESPVGACVQVPGYDLARLTASVLYRDNGVAVDSPTHAVPVPADPLPAL
jgi:hypothetical protein